MIYWHVVDFESLSVNQDSRSSVQAAGTIFNPIHMLD